MPVTRVLRSHRQGSTSAPYDQPTGTEKRCPWCHRIGHVRRSHKNCGQRIVRNNQQNSEQVNTSDSVTEVEGPVEERITCSHCGREGHSRRTHFNCAMNNALSTETNIVEAVEAPTVVRCRHCNREGHLRRTHFNCAMNPAFIINVQPHDNIATRNHNLQECVRNDIGTMDTVCVSCGAYMWIAERTTKSNNSALSFTSMNASLDHSVANNRSGAYAFRIHGSIYHLVSSNLTPNESNSNIKPKFAQIYIFDSENELQNRMNVAGNTQVSLNNMKTLQDMMHETNHFVRKFKTMKELADEQPNGIEEVRMVFKSQGTPDQRRYNNPTASEIGVLILGGDDDSDLEKKNRDIALRVRGAENRLARIDETHQHYEPLQYVLMFPYGDPGWHIDIKSIGEDSNEESSKIFVMDYYYSYKLMVRRNQHDYLCVPRNMHVGLHSFGKLFHQCVVDMYAKMEQQRLNFIRFNQRTLRAAVYNGFRDAIRLDDSDLSSIGKRVILPSTFIGGPRFMAQLYQDAMNIVRRFGKPDLFITFTCNPTWPVWNL